MYFIRIVESIPAAPHVHQCRTARVAAMIVDLCRAKVDAPAAVEVYSRHPDKHPEAVKRGRP